MTGLRVNNYLLTFLPRFEKHLLGQFLILNRDVQGSRSNLSSTSEDTAGLWIEEHSKDEVTHVSLLLLEEGTEDRKKEKQERLCAGCTG